MLLGLLPLPCFPKRPAMLVMDDGFARGFAQTLEKFEGFVVTLYGFGEIAFLQGQGAELAEDDTFAAELASQFLLDF